MNGNIVVLAGVDCSPTSVDYLQFRTVEDVLHKFIQDGTDTIIIIYTHEQILWLFIPSHPAFHCGFAGGNQSCLFNLSRHCQWNSTHCPSQANLADFGHRGHDLLHQKALAKSQCLQGSRQRNDGLNYKLPLAAFLQPPYSVPQP